MLDILERRRLLSSSVSGGILTVTGDDSANTIRISVSSSGKLKVSESGLSDKYYTQSSVNKIVVKAAGGKDWIAVASNVTKKCELQGGSGNDMIMGGGGVDALLGQDGNDILDGGGANDYLDGGKGSDTADYSTRSNPITATIKYKNSWGLTARGGGGGSGESDTFYSVETLQGGDGNDTLSAESDVGDWDYFDGYNMRINGSRGNDKITFGSGMSSYFPTATLKGSEGNDAFIINSLGKADCQADSGDDTCKSMVEGPVADFIPGSGRDRYDGGGQTLGGNDLVMENDLEELVGYQSVGSVTGNDLDNYISVTGPGLRIYGRGGNDTFSGHSGDDQLYGESGNDVIMGSGGDDTILGGGGDDSVKGGDGKDSIKGESGKDTLRGEGGNDSVYGGSSNDKLYGGDGNDYLESGTGSDTLYGDAGNDTFHTRDFYVDYLYGGSGTDTGIVGIEEEPGDIVSSIENYLP
jgi:Ca2+-binding RTX toxin-like protein